MAEKIISDGSFARYVFKNRDEINLLIQNEIVLFPEGQEEFPDEIMIQAESLRDENKLDRIFGITSDDVDAFFDKRPLQ